jgi:hypothetical protein
MTLIEAILATVIGGLIKDWLVEGRFWRPMAYVTIAGASAMIPILAFSYSVLTANYWIDIAYSVTLTGVFVLFARFPSRAVRIVAFSVPTALLSYAAVVSYMLELPDKWIGLLSVWPLAYVFALLVLMPVTLFVVTRRDFRQEAGLPWELVDTNTCSVR